MLLSPLLDIQEQDVHISDKHTLQGLTHLLHTPDPPHPSPSEGTGKIPGECWALAWIQGFTASLGSLYSRGRENTQLTALRSSTHSQSSGSSARCLLKPLSLTEFYSLSAPGWGFVIIPCQTEKHVDNFIFFFQILRTCWRGTCPLNQPLVFTVGRALLLQQVCSARADNVF